jgi:LemA protein
VSTTQITVLVVAAVLVFWMVGAYNRLVALRSAIGSVWALLHDGIRQRGDAVAPLVLALRAALAAEQGALDALLAADKQVRSAADALAARPVDAALAAAVVAGEAAMASAGSRVLALLEQHDTLRHDEQVRPHAATLRDSALGLAFSRQRYNEAAAAYNEAAALFPTRLLAELYRFGPAGRL